MYNPFRPHIVKINGKFAVRRYSPFIGWEFKDCNTHWEHKWWPEDYALRYCTKTSLEEIMDTYILARNPTGTYFDVKKYFNTSSDSPSNARE